MCVCTHTHRQGGLSEIHTLTYWNLIGRSITAPPPVSSPSNILPSLLRISQTFPQENFGVRLNNVTISVYGTFQKKKKLRRSEIA